MIDSNNAFAIAVNIIQAFLQFSIVILLLKSRVRWTATLASSFVLALLIFYIQPMIIGFVVYLFFITAYYYQFAKMRIKEALLSASIQIFLSSFVDNIAHIIYVFVPYTILRVNAVLILVPILALIKRMGISAISLTRDRLIFGLSLIVTFVSLGAISSAHFLLNAGELGRNVAIWNAMWLLAIQATSIYIIVTLSTFIQKVEHAELQKRYTKTLESSLDDWEGFKHGFRNLVNTLNGFCEAENYEDLVKYIYTLESDLNNDKNTIEINRSLKDNMPYIYGIVLSKAGYAIKNGIRFEVKVNATIFKLKTLSGVQLSRMVGNLLDNAMEHATPTTEKYVTMEISNHIREKIKIVIRNSVNQKIDTDKIFERGFSDKKDHTGFGLYEVKTIADNRREDGMYVDFNVSCTDDEFVADLLV